MFPGRISIQNIKTIFFLVHFCFAGFLVAYYFVAVYSYKAMKESMKRRSEIPRLDVSYAIPGENKDSEYAKCLNLLDNA